MSKIARTPVVHVNPTISVAPSATLPGRPLELDMHRKMFRVQPDFPMEAVIKLVSGTNPWRHNGLGWRFYELVLRPNPEATVGELLRLGIPHGIANDEAMEHLRWLFTWGGSYIAVNGQLYSPPPVGVMVPKRPRKNVAKKLAKAG